MASEHKHESQPHAFVFPYPVQGHILPMMRLSKLLASKHGFVVSFLNSQENHTRLTANNNELPSEDDGGGEPLDIRMLWLPDVPPSSEEISQIRGTHTEKSHIVLSKTFLNTDPAALEALIRTQKPPVSCLICDLLVPVIAPDLAQKLGISMFIFFTASAASLSMAILSGEVNGDATRMTSIVGTPPLDLGDVNPFLSMCGGPSDFMCRLFTQMFRENLVKASDTVLINTFYGLESATIDALQKQFRVCPIGPLLGSFTVHTLWAQEYSCLEWLDKQPSASVLFVSFGSLAPLSSTQLLELALGLEASHHSILWVTRPDLIYGKAPDLPPDFLDRVKDRLLVVSWAPQLEVLSHSAVGGFLTHCGWNSTLESISAGVPMLGCPFFGDQMLNCKFVVEKWRIGLRLTAVDGCMTRADVQGKVRELMEGELGKELRLRAMVFKHAAMTALAEGGSSYQNLQRVIQHAR